MMIHIYILSHTLELMLLSAAAAAAVVVVVMMAFLTSARQFRSFRKFKERERERTSFYVFILREIRIREN